ncbi:nucleotide exchange factor GrpE [Pelagibacteraceae bacterium]|jgi:molecular chaperone GrpE|nr:nucleotide exchange factor GrpE [Pelagibacteraceae bacterium]
MDENNQKNENSNKNTPQDDQTADPKVNEEKSLEEKLSETEDKLLRSLAEIENQRRRFEKEIKDAFEFGSFNFAKESLAILDNLQRAKIAIKNDQNLKENKDLDKFLENIIIIEKDLINIFEKNNIKKIDTKNKQFDPNLHQAMSEIENDNVQAGSIIQEMQAGYMLSERLLRPALVSVAKKKTDKKEEKDQKKEEK